MKRREFLRLSLAGIAAASFPMISMKAAEAEHRHTTDSLSPRRLEILDADWRLFVEPVVPLTTEIADWVWTPGTIDQAPSMTDPGLDTTGGPWMKTVLGENTVPDNSGGWFRANLPEIPGLGRTVRFGSVDDNATVYLNGQKLLRHTGWDSEFDVLLDSAWRDGGPNVLAVFVENINGPGGIYKTVTVGTIPQQMGLGGATYNDRTKRTVHLPHDYVVG